MNETRFITVTMSPRFERTLVLKYLAQGHRNATVEAERLYPSGKGVNISRALLRLGCKCHAILPLGNDLTGRAYRALIAEEGCQISKIDLEGPTSSQTRILDVGHEQETTITTEGAHFTEADIQRLAETLESILSEGDTVVLTGPLPQGAPHYSCARLIEVVHAGGADAVLIAGGPEMNAALATRPEMVVLNQIQCESLFNMPMRFQEDILNASAKLREKGAKTVLIEIQDGDSGTPLIIEGQQNMENSPDKLMRPKNSAYFVDARSQWRVDWQKSSKGNMAGVWDAFLAGLLDARSRKFPIQKSLQHAAAAAAYVADQVGSDFARPEDLEDYYQKVQVHRLEENRIVEDVTSS